MEKQDTPSTAPAALLGLGVPALSDSYEPAERSDPGGECRILRERIKLSEQARQRVEAENRRLEALLAGHGAVAPGPNYADFLSVLVHEFRNPLTPILTSAQLLKRYGSARPELLESATGSIERQVRQLSQMIADLSDFSRMERCRLELNLESLDVVALIDRVVETWGPCMAKRRQSLWVEWSRQPLRIQADPSRLGRAIEILLAHASRYTPAEGSVRLGLELDGRSLGVVVHSGAMGLDPARMDQIFEPFAPLDPPLHGGKHEGMGIALALAKYYAELHGGSIRAESTGVGTGGRFVIGLPISA